MDILKTYTEVFEILNLLGNEYIKKIPIELYNHIENNRDKKSVIEYDVDKDILEQNISEDARNMIAYLYLQYWCTQEEKQELMKQYQQNDNLYEEKMREKYNVDIFFNKKRENIKSNMELVEYKENIFKKIFKKIIDLIKRF